MLQKAKQINVLHITNTIHRGGKERQLFTIYKYADSFTLNKIVSIYKSNSSYLDEYNVDNKDLFFLDTRNNLKRVWRFYKIASREKPDIVFTWDNLSFLIAIATGIFLSYQTINGSIRHGMRSKSIYQYFRSFVLKFSRHIVANSYAGLKANKLNRGLVLYNGISQVFFKRVRNDFVMDDDIVLKHPVFISVANLVPYKDYYTIIEALAVLQKRCKEFTYLIIGQGPNRESVLKQIESHHLGDKIHVLGPKTNVVDYLHQADIFIHSSKGEGCSNAILEAMAAGLPIIASDTGGTGEIIERDFGRLFSFQDVEGLLKHITELAFNPQKMEEMGKIAKATAKEKYSVERMIKNYQEIIHSVIITK